MRSLSLTDIKFRCIMTLSPDLLRCTKKYSWQLLSLHLLEKRYQTRQTSTYHLMRSEWRCLKVRKPIEDRSSNKSSTGSLRSTNRRCSAKWPLQNESICSLTQISTCQACLKKRLSRLNSRCLIVQLRRSNWKNLYHQPYAGNVTQRTRSTPAQSTTAQRSRT